MGRAYKRIAWDADWAPRQRGYHPGDVQPDGSICTSDGAAMLQADIWVNKHQAKRAEVFGWKVIERKHGLRLVRRVDWV